MVFKNPENELNQGRETDKGDKVCTIEELSNWLNEEKEKVDFCIGVILLTVLIFILNLICIILST